MDCKNEFISLEQAKEDYGVVIDPDTFDVVELTGDRIS
jgi:N-methylhydantoinase B